MQIKLSVSNVAGNLTPDERAKLKELVEVFNYHSDKNLIKEKYYEGHVTLNDVNLGLALPDGIEKLEVGCEWGAKTVDVLASRSMFDGFVGADGEDAELMREIVDSNNLIAEYMKACRDELKYGCTFATLSANGFGKCKIRFHSPKTASALWDGTKGRISCALAIIDTAPDDKREKTWIPSILNMYTDDSIIVLTRSGGKWTAQRFENKMGRPLVEPLVWNATSLKPFGRSRLKEPVRNLINGYVRTVANATIGLEFSTAPQKYLLGITDEQYDALINDKFKQYVGSVLLATSNPESGQNPTFGQLAQGSLSPHVEMMRILATQFSAATGLTVTDTGVVNDANPTSSDAILAQSQTLVLMAEQLNKANGDALNTIARMAQAICQNCTLEDLSDEQNNVIANFKNPAMPSIAVTADAAVKIASVRPNFAQTDVFLEMLGFNQARIRRIKAQETRARGEQILNEEFVDTSPDNGEDINANIEESVE